MGVKAVKLNKMGQKVTLGGDRLGSGKKMEVELHNYNRSTHNLSFIHRTTMSPGTLVPFMKKVALPGDTWKIDLNAEVMTHPTVGPLFGSYKYQLDVFVVPIRLYQGQLHNNKLNIGRNMSAVKLPIITLQATDNSAAADISNSQINQSSVLAYLGIRGVGYNNTGSNIERAFNALGILAYWDIYKNYYANKQEEIGAVIHTVQTSVSESVDEIVIDPGDYELPTLTDGGYLLVSGAIMHIKYTGTPPNLEDIIIQTSIGDQTALQLANGYVDTGTEITVNLNYGDFGGITLIRWRYREATDITELEPKVVTFPLVNIDDMREAILVHSTSGTPYEVNTLNKPPYNYLHTATGGYQHMMNTQEGLAVKTYQSDLFNNWLNTEWIDGTGGINDITSVSTVGDNFKVDALNLAIKIYNMLNRVAVSDGSYRSWLSTTYQRTGYWIVESPIYMGGLIKELVFQEVVSTADTNNGDQPLGTLAGKGVLARKHKGGDLYIKVDEPSYIMGLHSLTPRIDYSQGNDWDVYALENMDDLHKPELDQIGFQDLIEEKMAFWTTAWDGAKWAQKSAGKQPAWLDYMTDYNRTYGNFAVESNEMFMTLNRRYERNAGLSSIKDLTTYIDPVKYNFIFAKTSIDAMNFWAQVGVKCEVRRLMSAKLMPNL